jgi:hypothetical protein
VRDGLCINIGEDPNDRKCDSLVKTFKTSTVWNRVVVMAQKYRPYIVGLVLKIEKATRSVCFGALPL